MTDENDAIIIYELRREEYNWYKDIMLNSKLFEFINLFYTINVWLILWNIIHMEIKIFLVSYVILGMWKYDISVLNYLIYINIIEIIRILHNITLDNYVVI